ncbi:MAG TPA: pitrilysin family protein [Candidatus Sulfotelmatobacter sp.]|jgi:zinc protease|nr:pitrilysin family protein [Candidatus Sulfotelmatobacter sp.]
MSRAMFTGRTILAAAALVLLGAFAPVQAFNIQRVTSDGGIEAWLIEDHANPIIAMNFAFKGGAAMDPEAKAGLSNMAVSLLDEGAGDMDSQTYQGKLEDLGISLGYGAGDDAVHGHLKTITDNRDTAFSMLALSLTKPRFDADAIERIRGQILADLARQQQDPQAIAGRALAKALYPDHPYGRATEGVEDTVKAITAADLKDYVPHRLGRDRLLIGVVGDITADQLKPLLDSTFGALPDKADPIEVPEVKANATGRVEVIRRQIPQSVVLFGEQGLKRTDPDWYTAYVMNYILGGGGFSSRLMTEVRVKRGLAYGVSSGLSPYQHGALLDGGTASRNEKTAQTIALIREEWQKMADGGVTDQELADAKTYLIGSYPLQMDSTASIAGILVAIQMDQLGLDYLDRRAAFIQRVSADDVKRVAKSLLDSKALSFVVVGNPAGL